MEDVIVYVGIVLRNTPLWAYAVLALLIVLGVRRLKRRTTTLLGLTLAPTVFFLWSLLSLLDFAATIGLATALMIWVAGLTIGWMSLGWSVPSRAIWQDSRLIVREGGIGPLAVYLSLFSFHYALEIWVGFNPDRIVIASALALAASSLVSGRTLGDIGYVISQRGRSSSAVHGASG